MCPEQGLELCQKYIQVQRKRQSCILLAFGRWVVPAASIKESEEREFVVDSGAGMHVVSKKRPELCCVGDDEDIKESDDGDDGQRRSANKKRSNGVCQRIGPIRDSYAS